MKYRYFLLNAIIALNAPQKKTVKLKTNKKTQKTTPEVYYTKAAALRLQSTYKTLGKKLSPEQKKIINNALNPQPKTYTYTTSIHTRNPAHSIHTITHSPQPSHHSLAHSTHSPQPSHHSLAHSTHSPQPSHHSPAHSAHTHKPTSHNLAQSIHSLQPSHHSLAQSTHSPQPSQHSPAHSAHTHKPTSHSQRPPWIPGGRSTTIRYPAPILTQKSKPKSKTNTIHSQASEQRYNTPSFCRPRSESEYSRTTQTLSSISSDDSTPPTPKPTPKPKPTPTPTPTFQSESESELKPQQSIQSENVHKVKAITTPKPQTKNNNIKIAAAISSLAILAATLYYISTNSNINGILF